MSHLSSTSGFQKSFPALPKRPVLPLPPPEKHAKSFSWDYIKSVFEAFAERERALELRIESICFNAQQSLRALEGQGSSLSEREGITDGPNPYLGIRLLQRMDQLQKENDDLSQRVEDLIHSTSMEALQSLQMEIQGTFSVLIKTLTG